MSKCVTIQLEQTSEHLELSPDTNLSETIKLEELSEFATITQSGVFGFTIPRSKTNDRILKEYTRVDQLDPRVLKRPLRVVVTRGGIQLEQNLLLIFSNSVEGYDAQLMTDDDFWKTALEKLKMCDVPLGVFDYTRANLEANWQSPEYTDGDVGVWFPLVHYGNWQDKVNYDSDTGEPLSSSPVQMGDFRPWLHGLYVLQKALCAVGWKFRSPILETYWGRRLLMYDLTAFDGSEGLSGFHYRAVVTETYMDAQAGTPEDFPNQPAFITPGQEVQALDDFELGEDGGGDSPGYYQRNPAGSQTGTGLTTYYYAEKMAGVMSFTVRGYVSTANTGSNILLGFIVIVRDVNETDPVQSIVNLIHLPPVPLLATRRYYEYTTPELEIEPHYRVTVVPDVTYNQGNTDFGEFEIEAGFEIMNNPQRLFIRDGMLMNLKSFMNCETTADLVLAGFTHLVSGKLLTDSVNKTLWLYSEHDTVIWDGSTVEGFYFEPKDAVKVDIEEICDSEVIEASTSLDTRYYHLKFQDADDDKVKSLGLTEENALYSKYIDLGDDIPGDDVTDDENPYFEPTTEHFAVEVVHGDYTAPTGQVDGAIRIPALWDNDNFSVMEKVGPRILYAHGLDFQRRFSDNTFTFNANWQFEDSQRESLPIAFQRTDELLQSLGAARPLEHVAYGDFVNDLYSMMHKQRILERAYAPTVQISAFLGLCDIVALNFRKLWEIDMKGYRFLGKLQSIERFEACTGAPADMFLKPHLSDFQCQTLIEVMKFQSCLYWHQFPMFAVPSPTGAQVGTINSFTIDGIEYVSSEAPVQGTVIVIGGSNYYTAFVDSLRALNIPNTAFDYPTAAEMAAAEALRAGSGSGLFRMTVPQGADFRIVARTCIGCSLDGWEHEITPAGSFLIIQGGASFGAASNGAPQTYMNAPYPEDTSPFDCQILDELP